MSAVALGTEGLPSQAEVMAQVSRENFPVASLVLGPRRRHLLAIYGYARLVDDVGDEVPAHRVELLDRVEEQLDAIYDGQQPEHPVMVTLADTIRACQLPPSPFKRLIEANRRDQSVTRYETFAELLDYCQLSAAPVGELVLHVFDAATPERVALSDRICAALQVIEHLQDIAEDFSRGRVYLPQEDLTRFGCDEVTLTAPLASPSGRALVAFEAQRARRLLAEGAALAGTLALLPRLAVAGFVAGGRTALRGLERAAQQEREPSRIERRMWLISQLPRAASGR
jgi:squalene synthase HpnC